MIDKRPFRLPRSYLKKQRRIKLGIVSFLVIGIATAFSFAHLPFLINDWNPQDFGNKAIKDEELDIVDEEELERQKQQFKEIAKEHRKIHHQLRGASVEDIKSIDES
eukprot:TRINITY_DN946_c0_g1_i1.p1 TRINITY_DN946_c0_g1~~TRINITY_DN946_c0_g1_i1.p1  ORF type:complete len:107 (-),score=38.27 TRINITY_DN946_c0_g1_i1:351-671(-)